MRSQTQDTSNYLVATPQQELEIVQEDGSSKRSSFSNPLTPRLSQTDTDNSPLARFYRQPQIPDSLFEQQQRQSSQVKQKSNTEEASKWISFTQKEDKQSQITSNSGLFLSHDFQARSINTSLNGQFLPHERVPIFQNNQLTSSQSRQPQQIQPQPIHQDNEQYSTVRDRLSRGRSRTSPQIFSPQIKILKTDRPLYIDGQVPNNSQIFRPFSKESYQNGSSLKASVSSVSSPHFSPFTIANLPQVQQINTAAGQAELSRSESYQQPRRILTPIQTNQPIRLSSSIQSQPKISQQIISPTVRIFRGNSSNTILPTAPLISETYPIKRSENNSKSFFEENLKKALHFQERQLQQPPIQQKSQVISTTQARNVWNNKTTLREGIQDQNIQGIKKIEECSKCKELENHVEQLANELQLQSSYQEKISEILKQQGEREKDLQKQITHLEEQLADELQARLDLDENTSKIEEINQSKISQLKRENQDLSRRNGEIERDCKNMSLLNIALGQQNQELEDTLTEMEKEKENAKRIENDLIKALQEANRKCEQFETKYIELNETNKIDSQRSEYTLELLKGEIVQSIDKRNEIIQENKELNSLNSQLKIEIEQMKLINKELKEKHEETRKKLLELTQAQTARVKSVQRSVIDLEKIGAVLNDNAAWKTIYQTEIEGNQQKMQGNNSQNIIQNKIQSDDEDVSRLFRQRALLKQELNSQTEILKKEVIQRRNNEQGSKGVEIKNQIEILKQHLEVLDLEKNQWESEQQVIQNGFECQIAQLKVQLLNKEAIIDGKYQENKFLLARVSELERIVKLNQKSSTHQIQRLSSPLLTLKKKYSDLTDTDGLKEYQEEMGLAEERDSDVLPFFFLEANKNQSPIMMQINQSRFRDGGRSLDKEKDKISLSNDVNDVVIGNENNQMKGQLFSSERKITEKTNDFDPTERIGQNNNNNMSNNISREMLLQQMNLLKKYDPLSQSNERFDMQGQSADGQKQVNNMQDYLNNFDERQRNQSKEADKNQNLIIPQNKGEQQDSHLNDSQSSKNDPQFSKAEAIADKKEKNQLTNRLVNHNNYIENLKNSLKDKRAQCKLMEDEVNKIIQENQIPLQQRVTTNNNIKGSMQFGQRDNSENTLPRDYPTILIQQASEQKNNSYEESEDMPELETFNEYNGEEHSNHRLLNPQYFNSNQQELESQGVENYREEEKYEDDKGDIYFDQNDSHYQQKLEETMNTNKIQHRQSSLEDKQLMTSQNEYELEFKELLRQQNLIQQQLNMQ